MVECHWNTRGGSTTLDDSLPHQIEATRRTPELDRSLRTLVIGASPMPRCSGLAQHNLSRYWAATLSFGGLHVLMVQEFRKLTDAIILT